MAALRRQAAVLGFFLVVAFPLFYFVYKFANPEPLAHDFFQYYRLYKDWDIDNVNAPFNMRLVGAFVVHLFYRAGLHYDTGTAFDAWQQYGFDREVFFCAVFFNYLCVVATSTVLFALVKKQTGDTLPALAGGMLFLLAFGTLFFALMPITDGFSVLLFSVILGAYLSRSKWAFVLLAVAVFQREYLHLAFGLVSLLDFVNSKNRYHLVVFVSCVVFFVVFYILRSTLFYTPALAFQTSIPDLWQALWHPGIRVGEYLRQNALSLNLFLVYAGVLAYKRFKGLSVNTKWFLTVVLLLVQLVLIGFAAQLGNNTMRYFYLASPLLIYYLCLEAFPLFHEKATKSP